MRGKLDAYIRCPWCGLVSVELWTDERDMTRFVTRSDYLPDEPQPTHGWCENTEHHWETVPPVTRRLLGIDVADELVKARARRTHPSA